MPKKPPVRKRSRSSSKGPTGPTFNQCTDCGGLVDAELVNGNDSWCPHCKAQRLVVTEYGRIPDPPMYGSWLIQQATKTNPPPVPQVPERPSPAPELFTSPMSLDPDFTHGDSPMKQAKTHTGTYSCLDCYTEYDLTAEKSLRCDCGGLLVKGTLEELGVDDADLDDEDE